MEKNNLNTDKKVTATQSQSPSNKSNVGAKISEWFRKQVVALKRRPSRIPMFLIVLSMIVYLMSMNNLSKAIIDSGVKNMGMVIFWATLASILVCVLFMNSYPKKQKPKIVMLILTYIFFAMLVCFDIIYINSMKDMIATGVLDRQIAEGKTFYWDSVYNVYAHLILLIVSIVVCALLPLISKALRKINTSVELEKSEMIETAHILEGDAQ